MTTNNIQVLVNDTHQLTLPADDKGQYTLNHVLAQVQSQQSIQPNSEGKLPVTIVGAKS